MNRVQAGKKKTATRRSKWRTLKGEDTPARGLLASEIQGGGIYDIRARAHARTHDLQRLFYEKAKRRFLARLFAGRTTLRAVFLGAHRHETVNKFINVARFGVTPERRRLRPSKRPARASGFDLGGSHRRCTHAPCPPIKYPSRKMRA